MKRRKRKKQQRKSIDYYPILVEMLADGKSLIDVCNYIKDNTWMCFSQSKEQVLKRLQEVEAERNNPPEKQAKKQDDSAVIKILRKRSNV